MKTKLCFLIAGVISLSAAHSQTDTGTSVTATGATASSVATTSSMTAPAALPLNAIKVNLTALGLKNFGLQYERLLNKKVAVGISVRWMPEGSLPYKSAIIDGISADDPDAVTAIESVRVSNIAITPEVRFYVGKKGFGRGFYIAPFYRFAQFKANNMLINYQGSSTSPTNQITLGGELTAHTGGILFGAQWPLGKYLCLDWSILGPHYGTGKGDFSGVARQPLTASEQSDIRQTLNDLDLPLTDKTITVNASGASMKLDGPWGGIRAAISIGFRF